MTEQYRKGLHQFLKNLHPDGIAGLGKDLKITRQTVYAWEKAGQIPDRHAPALIKFCDGNDAKISELSGWTSSAARNNLEKRVFRANALVEKKARQAQQLHVQTFGFNRDSIGEMKAKVVPVEEDLQEPKDVIFDNPAVFDSQGAPELGEPQLPEPVVQEPVRKTEHQPRRW